MTTQPKTLVPAAELSAAYRAVSASQAERVRRGAAIVGYKIGYTSQQRWHELGIQAPMWGAMYDDSVVEVGSGQGRFELSRIQGPRIEPELILHFHTAPAVDCSMQQLIDCIDWIAHGFELVMTPADGKQPTVPQAIMNGGMHAALLLGEPRPISELGARPVEALAGVQVELYCNGQLKEAGCSANVMDNPLNAVQQLMKGLRREGMAAIKAGDLVSTGTMTAAFPVQSGERWSTTLTGSTLPGMDVLFD